ncbi:DUF6928 family protein [Corynebacterium epidermidicanis]|uniref:Uncharacterized protein n=1 Tax=Corynebacterium epidermidicanis TaxID=1050174 RepID=A0A0G3GPZ1_9CORY|nr:hypothetical protein [Corynebacterium epidermidicanis]AKK02610.1 hypothetical protein CEPID_03680 [Corynebacterium epidermidicanis]
MHAHDAVVTLWFVNTDDPAAVLAKEPKANRGFGRKYLALMNPSWPISVFGQFPLNRSVQASKGEFYIAGYPGITVVQTVVEELTCLSQLSPTLLNSVPAHNTYAFATNPDTGFGGIAHWIDGKLRRSFCARRNRVYEDIGLPSPFESPFWAGERGETSPHSIDLPFEPIDLVHEADKHWLGVDISAEGPDLSVVGYAIDGRKEPRVVAPPERNDVGALIDNASAKLGLGPQYSEYDDYEDTPDDNTETPVANRARSLADGALKFTARSLKQASTALNNVREKLRHTDRS